MSITERLGHTTGRYPDIKYFRNSISLYTSFSIANSTRFLEQTPSVLHPGPPASSRQLRRRPSAVASISGRNLEGEKAHIFHLFPFSIFFGL